MPCSSLVALPRACGNEGIEAGLQPELYMISHDDLKLITGTTVYYSANTDGIIVNITPDTGKKFIKVGLLKDTAGLNEEMVKDLTKGVSFFNQTLTITLANLTTDNRKFVNSVLNQPISVLVKTRTNKWFAAGLEGRLELSALQGGTGIAASDLIGYTLTFTGTDTSLIRMVEDTLVPTIITV